MSSLLWYPGHELLLPEIVRVENCSLFAASGRRYVDLESGVWCTSIGHAHPRVLRVLAEQPAAIAHAGFNYSSAVVEEAAREVLSLLGLEGGRCVFLCSGSEAVEYGVRAARMAAEAPLFLTMADSYFGAYGSARERRAGEWFAFDWSRCAGRSGGCTPQCEHWAEIPFDRIGGFLFEPGSSSGLVRFPSVSLVQEIAREVRRRGGAVCVNEVTTGVGRTGRWFGFEHYGIAPDVVALGKGIGNGYPVSLTAFAPEWFRRIEGRSVAYAQSHQNDPLGAAVAREVVRIIREEELIERGRGLAAMLRAGLDSLRARRPAIREVRSRGLMLAVELDDDAEVARTRRVHRALIERGYLVGRRPGVPVLRIDPALTIEEADLRGFLAAFEEALEEIDPS